MPIALGEIRTCSSGICTHFASDYTLTAGTPPVSRNKHFRHSPVSSIARETVMHETPQLLSEGARHQASARTSAESDEACQRETKDKADGMRERRGHCLRRVLNLYVWDTRPLCYRLHHDGRHTFRQSKQTLQTLTRQLDRETIKHEALQLQCAGPRHQASPGTSGSAGSDEACQRKTKD